MDYAYYLLAPVVTEKGINEQSKGKYLFFVRRGVNKIEIRKAVEKLYNVKVENVNIVKSPQKKRMVRRGVFIAKRPERVKAVVTLKKGNTIDFGKVKEKK